MTLIMIHVIAVFGLAGVAYECGRQRGWHRGYHSGLRSSYYVNGGRSNLG